MYWQLVFGEWWQRQKFSCHWKITEAIPFVHCYDPKDVALFLDTICFCIIRKILFLVVIELVVIKTVQVISSCILSKTELGLFEMERNCSWTTTNFQIHFLKLKLEFMALLKLHLKKCFIIMSDVSYWYVDTIPRW